MCLPSFEDSVSWLELAHPIDLLTSIRFVPSHLSVTTSTNPDRRRENERAARRLDVARRSDGARGHDGQPGEDRASSSKWSMYPAK